MAKGKWVEWGDVSTHNHGLISLKRLGDLRSPWLPHIGVLDSGRYLAVLSYPCNMAGVNDKEFPTLQEAKDYIEMAVLTGIEPGTA